MRTDVNSEVNTGKRKRIDRTATTTILFTYVRQVKYVFFCCVSCSTANYQSNRVLNRHALPQVSRHILNISSSALMEHQHEFRQRVLPAYCNLKTLLDSVQRGALLRLLPEVPVKIVNLLTDLYSGIKSAVKCVCMCVSLWAGESG